MNNQRVKNYLDDEEDEEDEVFLKATEAHQA